MNILRCSNCQSRNDAMGHYLPRDLLRSAAEVLLKAATTVSARRDHAVARPTRRRSASRVV